MVYTDRRHIKAQLTPAQITAASKICFSTIHNGHSLQRSSNWNDLKDVLAGSPRVHGRSPHHRDSQCARRDLCTYHNQDVKFSGKLLSCSQLRVDFQNYFGRSLGVGGLPTCLSRAPHTISLRSWAARQVMRAVYTRKRR